MPDVSWYLEAVRGNVVDGDHARQDVGRHQVHQCVVVGAVRGVAVGGVCELPERLFGRCEHREGAAVANVVQHVACVRTPGLLGKRFVLPAGDCQAVSNRQF
jgi:hypothetical protein